VSRFEVFGCQLDLSQRLISRLALCLAFHSMQEQQPHCLESVLPPTGRFSSELINFFYFSPRGQVSLLWIFLFGLVSRCVG
jgi:hypothetical protein